MFLRVRTHDLFVILAPVKEEVVQQSRSCGRTRVKMKELAELVIIIGNVQRVLKARRSDVMAEAAETQHGAVSEQIPDIAEVFAFPREILTG